MWALFITELTQVDLDKGGSDHVEMNEALWVPVVLRRKPLGPLKSKQTKKANECFEHESEMWGGQGSCQLFFYHVSYASGERLPFLIAHLTAHLQWSWEGEGW